MELHPYPPGAHAASLRLRLCLLRGPHKCRGQQVTRVLTRDPRAQVYCAHEYTESNAKFAVSVNPQNELLKRRQQQVKELRLKVGPLLPLDLGQLPGVGLKLRALVAAGQRDAAQGRGACCYLGSASCLPQGLGSKPW